MSRLRSLFRNLVHRDRVDQDLDDEVRAVYTLLVDEKIQSGLSPEQARRAATLELGRVDSVKQQVRDERAGAYVDAFFKDLRYAARMLRTNLGFTLVIVLSLGAGIGANAAIFSVANAVLVADAVGPGARTPLHGPVSIAADHDAALFVSVLRTVARRIAQGQRHRRDEPRGAGPRPPAVGRA